MSGIEPVVLKLLDSVIDDFLFVVSCNDVHRGTTKDPSWHAYHENTTDTHFFYLHESLALFLNAPLRRRLGFVGYESSIFHGICFDLSLCAPKCRSRGKCVIKDALGGYISFDATGENIDDFFYVVKLNNGTPAADVVMELFLNSKIAMGIIEFGEPDYVNVAMNHYAASLSCPLLASNTNNGSEKQQDCACGEGGTEKGRKKIFESCQKCETDGCPVTVGLCHPHPLSQLLISYLGKSPLTNMSRFSYVGMYTDENRISDINVRDLEEFFVNAPIMMGMCELVGDDDIQMLFVNNATARWLGTKENISNQFTLEEFMNMLSPGEDGERVRKETVDMVSEQFRKTRERVEPIQLEVAFPLPTGGLGTFLSVYSCLSTTPDKSRHAWMSIDRTLQRKAERELEKYRNDLEENVRIRTLELQESEARFRSLVANAPSIIITIDPAGAILYMNRVGYLQPPLIGKAIQSLFTNRGKFVEQMQTLFASGQAFKIEVKLNEVDVWYNLNVGKVNDKLGIVIATDITEMKHLSEELHRAITTKSRFLANMSHEIRTPLSGVIGMARLLAETTLTIDQTDYVATIYQCGETLLSVINDVLDYTKLEATGEMAVLKQDISLEQVVEESLYTVVPLTQKKGIELILDVAPGTPDWVVGDSMRIRQILVNLLNNSVKFTDSGYILLSLRADKPASEADSLWVLYISVKDTGCGVGRGSQGKLFQMFSQVDTSTTRRFGGTGIGLALARRFAELMGGKIWMESTGIPGEGATFSFTIPTTLALTPPPPSFEYCISQFARSVEVIVVDKCEISQKALKRRLSNKGFTCITTLPASDSTQLQSLIENAICCKDNHLVLIFYDTEHTIGRVPNIECPHTAYIFLGAKMPEISFSESKSNPNKNPIFEFARKPLKDSAIYRCLLSIAQQVQQISSPSTALVPPLSCIKKGKVGTVFPLSIMVVEDNEINKRVICKMLTHMGFTKITVAGNGQQALDLMDTVALPDMILMDLQMPILDGIECTRIIRKKYGYGNWPFISSMTADAFQEDRQNCLSAGMNEFLTKPIRLEQLKVTLENCIKLKSALENTR